MCIRDRAWKGKDGNNRKRIYVRAQRVEFLNARKQEAKMEPQYEEPGGGYSMDSDAFVDGDTPF